MGCVELRCSCGNISESSDTKVCFKKKKKRKNKKSKYSILNIDSVYVITEKVVTVW